MVGAERSRNANMLDGFRRGVAGGRAERAPSELRALADVLSYLFDAAIAPSRSDPARQLGVSSPLAQPARAHPKKTERAFQAAETAQSRLAA